MVLPLGQRDGKGKGIGGQEVGADCSRKCYPEEVMFFLLFASSTVYIITHHIFVALCLVPL